jgi:CheY-like chemotaxis protein
MLRDAAKSGTAYDLAILDMEMPGMDGRMLANAIKADPELTKTKLIILTSLGEQLEAEELKASGLDACLVKPARQGRLFDCIARALAGREAPEWAYDSKKDSRPIERLKLAGRILLAEDNTINQEVALGQLEQLGLTAEVVTNGKEVLEALQHEAYDIILMDCMMPEMDGYEATRTIRTFEKQRAPGYDRNQPLHIVAMTANAMQGEDKKCYEAGMNDYVSKPVQILELRRALSQWKRVGDESDNAPAAPAEPAQVVASAAPTPTQPVVEEIASEPVPVDLERLREVSVGRPEKIRHFVGIYLKQAEEMIPALGQAIQNGSPKEVRDVAHKFKGASSSLGMVAVAPLLMELEKMAMAGKLDGAPEIYVKVSRQLDRIRQFIEQHVPKA